VGKVVVGQVAVVVAEVEKVAAENPGKVEISLILLH
jgi:hypothetical protein